MHDGPRIRGKRSPNTSGVFSAELYAILMALVFVRSTGLQSVVIFSDSLSVLQAHKRHNFANKLVIRIHRLLSRIEGHVTFEWVPGHCNIVGNEAADRAAREATQHHDITPVPLLYTDFKFLVKQFVLARWQQDWAGFNSRLNGIKPEIADWKSAYRESRWEECVLSRLRTGCCRFLIQHFINPDIGRELCNFCSDHDTGSSSSRLCSI